MQPPRLVQINHRIRTASFAWAFLVVALVLHEREAGALAWALLAAQFFFYPQLVYLAARRSAAPRRTEIRALYVDAALLGAWTAALGFPTWIAYGALFATGLNNAVVRGIGAAAGAWVAFAIGALLWMLPFGFTHFPGTSSLVTLLCVLGSLVYASAVGMVVHQQNRRLRDARDALREGEARYRLIAEHAADLVGMVDLDGRWRYTSPSFGRVLAHEDVAEGRDAFARVHEEDQFLVRGAVQAVMRGGESCALQLRLQAAAGDVRRFEGLCHAVHDERGAVTGAVLALRDVTAHANGQRGNAHANGGDGARRAIPLRRA